jgi:DNA invertase Pin-like site-specific DNA recombinase
VSKTLPVGGLLSLSSLTFPGMTSYRLGYARVSTLEQDPAAQLDALRAAGVDQVFVDHASGVLTERPELAKLLGQLRSGDTLVVWRLDRLGRSTSHLIQTVTELGERGIGFHSLTEAIDTTTSAGRLLFGILASLAAFERDLIRERTAAGLAAARERGRVGGRPSSMTADKLAVARQMLAEGRPKSVIAKTIGVSRPTLYEHLGRNSSEFVG